MSGGYSSSVKDSLRKSIEVSKLLTMLSPDDQFTKEDVLNHHEAFYLATLGGARVMGLDSKIGTNVAIIVIYYLMYAASAINTAYICVHMCSFLPFCSDLSLDLSLVKGL